MIVKSRQLAGIGSDILDAINNGLNTIHGTSGGYGGILDVGQQIVGDIRNAHIPYQNQLGDQFTALSNAYNQLKAAGQLDGLAIDNSIAKVRSYLQGFANTVNRINTTQARRGLSDMSVLADRMINSMQADKTRLAVIPGSGSTVPVYSATGGGSLLGGIDISTMVMIGFGLMLLRGK